MAIIEIDRKFVRLGMSIYEHGSWNRNPPNGQEMIFVLFDAQDSSAGAAEDVVSELLDNDGNAFQG